VYARRTGGKELTFDFAAGLVNDNLLVVDRETSSVWSQLDNRAISGPMKGTSMSVVPSVQTTWKFWRTIHRNTRVMVVAGKKGRPYFYSDWVPGTPRPKAKPTTHHTANLGLGIALNGQSFFLPFRALDKMSAPLSVTIGDQPLIVYYQRDALTAWAEDPDGNLVPSVLAYEQGWKRFHPESYIYSRQSP